MSLKKTSQNFYGRNEKRYISLSQDNYLPIKYLNPGPSNYGVRSEYSKLMEETLNGIRCYNLNCDIKYSGETC
jgi:hypothetical protein